MKLLFCLILAALGLGSARADQPTFYFGAGISYDNVSHFILEANPQNTRTYPDISAASGKALIGFRPLNWFALEADYFGTASTTDNFGDRSEVQAVAGYAVFLTGAKDFDVFLKAGINGYTLTAAGPLAGGEKDTGGGFAGGAGMQWRFGLLGMRFEYEWLPSLGKTNGLQAVSLELTLNVP